MPNILRKLFKKPGNASPSVAEAAPAPVIAPQPSDTAAQTAPKPTKAPKEKPTPNAPIPTATADGVAHRMREAVVAEPTITFEDAAKKIGVLDAKRGGHAWNIYSEAKRVMEIVQSRAGRS